MISSPVRKTKTKSTEIWVDEEGILRVCVDEGAVLEEDEVQHCFEIYRRLKGQGEKFLQLMDGRKSVSMSPEGKAYVAKFGKEIFIASAIISDTLAIRLVVNFFIKFYKPEFPFKMFATEAEALKWLRKFRE